MKVSRRNFLKLSSMAGGGLAFHIVLPHKLYGATPKLNSFEPNLLVSIASDNTVTFSLTKQEMGQGITTGMPMIFADELGADLFAMKIVRSDYNPQVEYSLQGITGGSSSIQSTWIPLRQSAAIAREMLVQAAAESWKVDKHACYAENSMVIHRPSGKECTFGSLVEKAIHLPVPKDVTLKDPRDFRYIGRPIKNLKTKDIVTSKYEYGMDVNIPGMLYASIERCPVHLGKIKTYNDIDARQVNGVVDVIKIAQMVRRISVGVPGWDHFYDYTIEEGLAVVATNTWSAMQGRNA